jgi:uncharacterized membrane protein
MFRSLSLLSACIATLALGACTRQETPAAEPVVDTTATPAATPPSAPAAEPPAESSLALKRGKLTLASAQATFQPCGSDAQLWLIDQSDGVLRETFASEPKPLELYIEAHGERTSVPIEVAAASAYRGAFILEEVLYAAPAGESQGCQASAPTYVVFARGNEPFWSVEIAADKLIWRQPEEPKELVIDAPQIEDVEGTVGYSGTAQGHSVELFVEAEACRDSMSGAYFAYGARATFDGKGLKGCARIGE